MLKQKRLADGFLTADGDADTARIFVCVCMHVRTWITRVNYFVAIA